MESININGIDIEALAFAYDGCHKIFLLETLQDVKSAQFSGYEIHDLSELVDTLSHTCSSRHITTWSTSRVYMSPGAGKVMINGTTLLFKSQEER